MLSGKPRTQAFLMRTAKTDQTVLMLCDVHLVFSCQCTFNDGSTEISLMCFDEGEDLKKIE